MNAYRMQYSIIAFLRQRIYGDAAGQVFPQTWEEIVEQELVRQRKVDRSRLLPELRRMLELAEATSGLAVEQQTPQEARASSEIRIASQWGAKDHVETIEDFRIPAGGATIPARLYRSAGTTNTILYFHGGGWVVGNLETHDGMLRAMTLATGANILSVEYRKAPEAPFPAALDDAEAALDWLDRQAEEKHLDSGRLIVMGDSAGASIAAALSVRARDRARPVFGQVLIYPATDLAHDTPSREQFAFGYSLNASTFEWFARHYLSGGTKAADPEVSPLLTDDLKSLPPTMLVTADHDPLRDEGRAYAAKLIGAGNDVSYVEWRGVVHGFMMMDRFTPASRKLIGRIADWCGSLWSR
jgi:acetyl esterase